MPGDGVDAGEPSEFPRTYTGKSFREVDHIVNKDGLYLFCKYWKPEGEIRALVFHVHGYAEHCARSVELAEKMKELGIFSFAHDHVGHGESQGPKGQLKDFKAMVRDVLQHIDLIQPKYAELPIFIYGHSLGGAVALLAAHERPNLFSGVMLSAPYIKPSPETATPFKVFLAKVVAWISPSVRIGKLDPSFLSRDKAQVEHYMKDKLNDTDGMRAGTAIQYLEMAKELEKVLPTMDKPIFVAHSEADKICGVAGSKLLVEVSNSKDKTLKVYKEAEHMLEHELPDFTESYFNEVLQWIKQRLP